MWFGFGIITLVISLLIGLKARLAASWKGELAVHPRGNCQVQEIRHKGKLVKMRIGLAAPAHFNFGVRTEGLRDRLFKWLGVSIEIQTKDEEFDRTLYVESDARGVGILLKRRPDLRRTLIDIFAIARRENLSSMRLRCMSKRLWVEFRPKSKERVPVESLATKLHDLVDAISNHRLELRELHDRFVWRAAAVLALSTASAVLGFIGIARAAYGRTDILDPWSLFAVSAALGALVAVVLLLGIVGWLGASSRAHTVILEFALVGICGFALSSFALAREMNIDFDFKPAKTYLLEAVRAEHTITRGRRGRKRHHYYLHTQSWQPAHSSAFKRLEISESDYRKLVDMKEAILHVRPGALGFEWVESIQPSWGELERS